MPDEFDIRYARSGDLHIAYEIVESGGSRRVDVLRIAAFVSNLQNNHALPTYDEGLQRLASLGRVINYDNRGTGLSDRVRAARLPSIEERMDDLRAVLDAAGSERAALVCYSDGGPLGCLFAATYPERTVALVLCNTAPRIAWAPDYPWGMRPEDFEHNLHELERGWGTRSYAESMVRANSWEGIADDVLVDWWVTQMRLSGGPGDAATAFRLFYESDVRNVLGTIRVPTLVLTRGGEMAAQGRAFADLIPGARHGIMPGTGKQVMSEHRAAYSDAAIEFVGEIHEEDAELESILATVLFTDIVDSTARQASMGDRRWTELVEQHHRVVRGALARYRGRELDTAGDGFFAAFDGPARAVRCAQGIVEGVRELGIEIRAGLHTGECRTIDGKIGGLAVSIGARVSALAGPSEVVVSQTVRDLVAGSGLAFDDRGEHALKGVPGTWRAYVVV